MRRYNIDYLRLFGIFLLFPFHAFRLFDPYEAFYIESAVKSLGGVKFMSFLWPWFMPLMFLVAGISTWYALQKRTGKQYIFTQFFSDFSDLSGYQGTFTPAHLWFILYLFVFSIIFKGLFVNV